MNAPKDTRQSLYSEVTIRIIAELEAGRLPWVQPWDRTLVPAGLPLNAVTKRPYSGVNILILWQALFEAGFTSQRWLTYRQAQALGANVRKGERGIAVCYADRFLPRDEIERARVEQREARERTFLKRYTIFNVAQCDGLDDRFTADPELGERETIEEAEALISATGATIRIGGDKAFYAPRTDIVQVPPQQAFHQQINWYRTVLHELGHWTGHVSRLDRDQAGAFGSDGYAREELIAEMTSAFVCAALSIRPTVRHADYIGSWLTVLRGDDKAIFRAASAASKAANFLLACPSGQAA